MKRFSFILCIITFSMLFSSCRAVNINSSDELLHSSWQAENTSSIKAELTFDIETDTAHFIITDQNQNKHEICGIFAVDSNNLYITSANLKKTYSFTYKVYKDRLILCYNETELTFNAAKEKKP